MMSDDKIQENRRIKFNEIVSALPQQRQTEIWNLLAELGLKPDSPTAVILTLAGHIDLHAKEIPEGLKKAYAEFASALRRDTEDLRKSAVADSKVEIEQFTHGLIAKVSGETLEHLRKVAGDEKTTSWWKWLVSVVGILLASHWGVYFVAKNNAASMYSEAALFFKLNPDIMKCQVTLDNKTYQGQMSDDGKICYPFHKDAPSKVFALRVKN
jgi:hypothetical protein